MIKNYFKLALCGIARNKVFATINILGLSTAIASCLFIGQYLQFKWSFDDFHEHAADTYRVTEERVFNNKLTERSAQTPVAIGPQLKADFPEVITTTAFTASACVVSTIEAGNSKSNAFNEPHVYFVDSSFLKVFTFPLLQGSSNALNQPGNVIITEAAAKKYFGTSNPIGHRIKLENHNEGLVLQATIKGVCHNVPPNSHLQFSFLVSARQRLGSSWSNEESYTYLLLSKGASQVRLENKLNQFVEKHTGQDRQRLAYKSKLALQPLKAIYLSSSTLKRELNPGGDSTLVWILAASAFLILLLAYINYVNLSIAQSLNRAREVGVRKVLGSGRQELMKQFLLEALVYNLISFMVAFVLFYVTSTWFRELSGISQSASIFIDWKYWVVISVFCVLVFSASATYPAFMIASIPAIKELKGNNLYGGRHPLSLRQGLVVFQFTVSIGLMIAATSIYRQVQFMRSQNLGIDLSHTFVITAPETRRETQADEEAFLRKIRTYKTEISRLSGVSSVTFASGVPGEEPDIRRPYKRKGAVGSSKNVFLYPTIFIGPEFIKQLKLELVAGVQFNDHSTTSQVPVMINQAAAESMGFSRPKDALGQIITDKNARGRTFDYQIVGVTRNFHQTSLKEAYLPTVFKLEDGSGIKYFVCKVASAGISGNIKKIEAAYHRIFNAMPWEYFFLDEFFAKQYLADEQFGRVFKWFTAIAIVIACLGLFGLVLFVTNQRTREIGLRKVLGATKSSLWLLLTNDYLMLILLSTLLALPFGWWGTVKWLQNYAFHFEIDIWIFLLPPLAIIGIALVSVSLLIIRASSTNPVDALRIDT